MQVLKTVCEHCGAVIDKDGLGLYAGIRTAESEVNGLIGVDDGQQTKTVCAPCFWERMTPEFRLAVCNHLERRYLGILGGINLRNVYVALNEQIHQQKTAKESGNE